MTNSFFIEIIMWVTLMSMLIIMSCSMHPILMIITLISYTILICLNFSIWKQTYMFSLLFFLLTISGLLIIFLYFTSLISNEKSQVLSLNYTLWPSVLFLFSSPFLIFKYSPNIMLISSLNKSLTSKILVWTSYDEIIYNLYSYPLINMTLISMLFLLITLLSIIKISTPKIKSLRKISI